MYVRAIIRGGVNLSFFFLIPKKSVVNSFFYDYVCFVFSLKYDNSQHFENNCGSSIFSIEIMFHERNFFLIFFKKNLGFFLNFFFVCVIASSDKLFFLSKIFFFKFEGTGDKGDEYIELCVFLILDQFVDMMLSPMVRSGNFKYKSNTEQSFLCVSIGYHLEK